MLIKSWDISIPPKSSILFGEELMGDMLFYGEVNILDNEDLLKKSVTIGLEEYFIISVFDKHNNHYNFSKSNDKYIKHEWYSVKEVIFFLLLILNF